MKLEAVHEDKLYLSDGRQLFVEDSTGEFEHRGTVPNPHSRLSRVEYELKTGQLGELIRKPITGDVHSTTFWPISEDVIFANVTRWLYRSDDGGISWKLVKPLRKSSGIRGVMPPGFCYSDGTVYIGEYIFDENATPRVLASDDYGESWYTALECEDVRHIHSVQIDPYTQDIWVTTGDRDEESMIGRFLDEKFEIIGSASQIWRTVELAFTPDYVLWGTDSSYSENSVVKLPREKIGEDVLPEKVSSTDRAFYYTTTVDVGSEILVFFSTGGGFQEDSTAPNSVTNTTSSDTYVRLFGSSSHTDFAKWHMLMEFEINKPLARRFNVHSMAADSYVFLCSSSQRGLFFNPLNASPGSNQLFNIPIRTFQQDELVSAFSSFTQIHG